MGSRVRRGKKRVKAASEWNGEGNMVDFGARVYVARLGRWLAIDPLSHQYTSFSPYSYGLNNPIINIDKEGKSVANWEIEWVMYYFGFGGQETITSALNSMGLEGKMRAVVAFAAGAAFASSNVNVIDAGRSSIEIHPAVMVGKIIYSISNGDEVGHAVLSEVPGVNRIVEYYDNMSKISTDVSSWGDEEWCLAGTTFAMGAQDASEITKGVMEHMKSVRFAKLPETIKNNPKSIWGASEDQIAASFRDAGYRAWVEGSSRKGSSGLVLQVRIEGHPYVNNIQVHPGGVRKGGAYYKFGTSTGGVVMVENRSTYKPSPDERLNNIIWLDL